MSLPFVISQAVWSAKAATETIALQSDFERCEVTVIEITTTGFSGTLDIQGKLHEISEFSNVPYIRQDQASLQTPSVTQLSFTLDTAVYRYVVLGYWRRLQLVMTRSAGSITVGVAGSSDAKVFPYLPTKLIASSGVDIGSVGHNITGIGHGVKVVTTAGTDVALASSTTAKAVMIQAQTDNTSAIAVGASGVDATIATGTGIILYAGEWTPWIPIDNLADIYIDSLVNGEGVRFIYLT